MLLYVAVMSWVLNQSEMDCKFAMQEDEFGLFTNQKIQLMVGKTKKTIATPNGYATIDIITKVIKKSWFTYELEITIPKVKTKKNIALKNVNYKLEFISELNMAWTSLDLQLYSMQCNGKPPTPSSKPLPMLSYIRMQPNALHVPIVNYHTSLNGAEFTITEHYGKYKLSYTINNVSNKVELIQMWNRLFLKEPLFSSPTHSNQFYKLKNFRVQDLLLSTTIDINCQFQTYSYTLQPMQVLLDTTNDRITAHIVVKDQMLFLIILHNMPLTLNQQLTRYAVVNHDNVVRLKEPFQLDFLIKYPNNWSKQKATLHCK